MASLVVRDIDKSIVNALKARAGAHGISAEAEHRKILETILLQPKKKEFYGSSFINT
jgi:plasmid stability protein